MVRVRRSQTADYDDVAVRLVVGSARQYDASLLANTFSSFKEFVDEAIVEQDADVEKERSVRTDRRKERVLLSTAGDDDQFVSRRRSHAVNAAVGRRGEQQREDRKKRQCRCCRLASEETLFVTRCLLYDGTSCQKSTDCHVDILKVLLTVPRSSDIIFILKRSLCLFRRLDVCVEKPHLSASTYVFRVLRVVSVTERSAREKSHRSHFFVLAPTLSTEKLTPRSATPIPPRS